MTALDRPILLVTAMAYLAVVVVIGIWAARRTRTARDFFIAGQSVGLWITGLATMSAAFSGFVFIGGPGLTYRMGIASLFICIPVGFTAALLGWTVARQLRRMAEKHEIYTVPDAILHRYRSRVASGLAAVAVVIGTIGYLGAQLLALGVVVEEAFGTEQLLGVWSRPVTMAAGLVLILLYATVGGMLAGVYTDLLQGLLMVMAAAGVFFYALTSSGGPAAMARSIAEHDSFGPAFLDPLGTVPPLTALGFFFVFGIGVLGQPHMLHKFYMLDDPRKLKWIPALLGGTQAICVLLWLGIGLAVPALVAQGRIPPLTNPDDAAPVFLLHFTPQLLAGLVFAGILAAIMSTADSFVNVGAAAVVRDLPKALGRPLADELFWGRIAVVGLGVASAIFAGLYQDLVALVGTFAFGTFGAALAPALAVGLNWSRVTAGAASASIATGMGLNLFLEFLAKQTYFPSLPKPTFLAPGVLPAAVSLAASFVVLMVWSWIGGRDSAARPAETVQPPTPG
ncbi:MAG: hypothetical protein MPN21_25110 [Thermoanaerobaculia bacterium]|nr:hypothetical protein [Thermoanaerobaculia bacterium]